MVIADVYAAKKLLNVADDSYYDVTSGQIVHGKVYVYEEEGSNDIKYTDILTAPPAWVKKGDQRGNANDQHAS